MFLDKIVRTKQQELEVLAQSFELGAYERMIADMPPCRGFERALGTNVRHRKLGLIAEVKKASPSKGLIRESFEPVELAVSYEQAGADCISVLTDVDYFQGSNAYLTAIKEAVKVPLLRKDFTIDYRQVYEARVIGADAILLIAAILTSKQLSDLGKAARSIGLDVLVEVHNQEELERVLELDEFSLIGINNRNLHTFVTDLKTTEELIPLIPKHVTIISESGIAGPDDFAFLEQVGSHGLLIGEYFMRQSHVGKAVEGLMGERIR